MKQYDLDIIAADKTVRFSVMEPETKEEKSVAQHIYKAWLNTAMEILSE